jgi:hypothetical protein
VASWRTLYGDHGAIKITGSPFKSFDEAEVACDALLKQLMSHWEPDASARACHNPRDISYRSIVSSGVAAVAIGTVKCGLELGPPLS